MQRIYMHYLFLAGLFVLVTGCSGVISPQLVEQVEKNPSLQTVRNSPGDYVGQMVIWAGEIIETKNERQGSCLQVLEKSTDISGEPKDDDSSGGRFLAVHDQYLDTAIYQRGRKVTVAGRLQEIRSLPLGATEYSYPVIRVEQLHLWPKKRQDCPCFHEVWIGAPYWYYYW